MNPIANQVSLFTFFHLDDEEEEPEQDKEMKIICTRKSINLCITEYRQKFVTNFCTFFYELLVQRHNISVISFEIVDTVNEWKLHKEIYCRNAVVQR